MRVHSALDRVFRRFGVARIAYELGLQGRLAVRSRDVRVGRPASRPPLRVAFASDFHAGPTTDPRMLARACEEIVRAAPDVILLGGDFVNHDPADVATLAPVLATLRAPLGTYAVLGNHDVVVDSGPVVAALQAAGVQLLTNRAQRLAPAHDDVFLLGLDDPISGTPRAEAAFAPAQAAGSAERQLRIVLMHAPDGLLAIGEHDFDLAFCGHTHGGQVALPWGIPIVLPRGRLSRRFARGWFRLRRGGALLVSHGIGCSALPVRLFARPEVHVCTVVAG